MTREGMTKASRSARASRHHRHPECQAQRIKGQQSNEHQEVTERKAMRQQEDLSDEEGRMRDTESIGVLGGLSASKELGAPPKELSDEMIGDRKILAKILLGVDVTEIHSPERVAKVCIKYGMKAGSSMDLLTGWDFDKTEHRKMAEKKGTRGET